MSHVRAKFRCRAIEYTVCTVEKPLCLWRVHTRIVKQVCVCVCVSVCMLFLYTGGDLNLNTHRLMGTCHGGDLN